VEQFVGTISRSGRHRKVATVIQRLVIPSLRDEYRKSM